MYLSFRGNPFFQVFLDKECFDEPVWVCLYYAHLHMSSSLISLIWEVLTEFNSDKHLAV